MSLILIVLGSIYQGIAIGDLLIKNGYRDTYFIEGENFLQTDDHDFPGILVLQFNSPVEVAKLKKSSLFYNIAETCIIGVICNSKDNVDHDLLDFCNDLLTWSGHEKEFIANLDQACSRSGFLLDHIIENSFLEEFVHLNMVGCSLAFLNVLKKIKKISRYDIPVLIEGPTGTGKELSARAIHYLSDRRDYPFIPVNCGALPDTLLENELFGHKKGAYTDAKNVQSGLVSLANKGTLFLDEVEAFTPKGQVVLLRFLQNMQYRPLGGYQQMQADVRIITASNIDLVEMVEQGLFRQDLLYRLNVMSIKLPPLSKRAYDIRLLAEYFLGKYRTQYNQPEKYLHPNTLLWMQDYSWPGNVRELENLIHREFLLTESSCINIEKLTAAGEDRRKNVLDRRQNLFVDNSFQEAKAKIIDQFEKEYITCLIKQTNGNVTLAAKHAGKERRAFGKLIKKHGIIKESAAYF